MKRENLIVEKLLIIKLLTGSNTNEKYTSQNFYNNAYNNKRLLKNNRNKSYYILESSISKNSSIKDSNNFH